MTTVDPQSTIDNGSNHNDVKERENSINSIRVDNTSTIRRQSVDKTSTKRRLSAENAKIAETTRQKRRLRRRDTKSNGERSREDPVGEESAGGERLSAIMFH